MRAGRLRHRVTVQSETQATDGAGGYGLSWTNVGEVWAAVEPMSARERTEAGQLEDATTHRIMIRYRSDVVPTGKHRVLFGTRTFNVREIINQDERKEHLVLMCDEGVAV